MFEDEMGSAFGEGVATTWAPQGQTPILRRIGYFRRVLSTSVGLTLSGRLLTRHFHKAIGGAEAVATLRHFRRYLHGPLLVIWDRSQPHRSRPVQAYLAEHPEIAVAALPPYAPELNPEEYAHGWVKRQLRNMTPADDQAMHRLLRAGFARLRRRPDVLLGCFRHAGLALKQFW